MNSRSVALAIVLAAGCGKNQASVSEPPGATGAAAPEASTHQEQQLEACETLDAEAGRLGCSNPPIWRELIKESLPPQIAELQRCYEKTLRTVPDSEGSVSYAITVKVDGTVGRVELDPDGALPPVMLDCTRETIGRWSFPMDGAWVDEDVDLQSCLWAAGCRPRPRVENIAAEPLGQSVAVLGRSVGLRTRV